MTSAITSAVAEFGAKNIMVRLECEAHRRVRLGFTTVMVAAYDEPGVYVNFLVGTRWSPGVRSTFNGRAEDYKIELISKYDKYNRSFYTSDLSSIWRDGHAEVFVIQQDGEEQTYRKLNCRDFSNIELNDNVEDFLVSDTSLEQ